MIFPELTITLGIAKWECSSSPSTSIRWYSSMKKTPPLFFDLLCSVFEYQYGCIMGLFFSLFGGPFCFCFVLLFLVQCVLIHYCHIPFDAQIVTNVTSRSPLKLATMSLWYIPSHLWAFPSLLTQQDTLYTFLYFLYPRPAVSHFSKEPSFLLEQNSI